MIFSDKVRKEYSRLGTQVEVIEVVGDNLKDIIGLPVLDRLGRVGIIISTYTEEVVEVMHFDSTIKKIPLNRLAVFDNNTHVSLKSQYVNESLKDYDSLISHYQDIVNYLEVTVKPVIEKTIIIYLKEHWSLLNNIIRTTSYIDCSINDGKVGLTSSHGFDEKHDHNIINSFIP